jgi:hypothetical protein
MMGDRQGAREGSEEGAIAGPVMVLVGLFNVLIAPLLAQCRRYIGRGHHRERALVTVIEKDR